MNPHEVQIHSWAVVSTLIERKTLALGWAGEGRPAASRRGAERRRGAPGPPAGVRHPPPGPRARCAPPAGGEVVPWSRWIPPAEVKVRFDTWFFVTESPPGATATPDGGEC